MHENLLKGVEKLHAILSNWKWVNSERLEVKATVYKFSTLVDRVVSHKGMG